MSENPDARNLVLQMERLWDESFIFASRLMERHAGRVASDREGYWIHLPAIANYIYHDCLQAGTFLAGASATDIEVQARSSHAILVEMTAINTKARNA